MKRNVRCVFINPYVTNMLQLPDFKEKNIVFIGFDDDAKIGNLRVKNENLAVYDKFGQLINQVSCSTVFAVFVCGSFSISSNLIRKLLNYGISIYFTTKYNFRVYAEIGSKAEGNYWLREKQYSFKDEIGFSKNLLYNKIYNQYGLIKELKPDFFKEVSKAVMLKKTLKKIEKCQNIDELMGIEGAISKDYFKVIFEDNSWYKRLPRTKVDVNNFLLDMGYTFLFNFVDSLLRLHGVD